MKIAIIGAGFTGLSAGFNLAKKGHRVFLFERADYVGGLGAGMRDAIDNFPNEWEWDLEQYYHHWFTNDQSVFDLGQALGVSDSFIIKRPISSILYENKMYQFDSPLAVLTFPHLPFIEKIKTGLTMASLKYWYTLESSSEFESVTAAEYLRKHSGEKAYEILWQPLLEGKFGEHYQNITMRWFWARIFKRTPKLAYFTGGFSQFAKAIAEGLTQNDGKIYLSTQVEKILHTATRSFQILGKQHDREITEVFDRVIVTTPPFTLAKLMDSLPDFYTKSLQGTKGLGAYVIILSLQHPLMKNTYWLNVNDTKWPFLSVVEHTNFMDKKHYNNENIVYVGDYVPADHPHMQASTEELITKFTPYLKEINPLFGPESIIRTFHFKTPYAQPIVGLNHQESILPLETPISGLYLASMAQVYPWDRGTNYAIELGKTVSDCIT